MAQCHTVMYRLLPVIKKSQCIVVCVDTGFRIADSAGVHSDLLYIAVSSHTFIIDYIYSFNLLSVSHAKVLGKLHAK